MENEKNLNFEAAAGKESEFQTENSSRARNRTVMLTPEITGQVRARIAQELEPAFPGAAPTSKAAGSEGMSVGGTFVPGGQVSARTTDSGDFKSVVAQQAAAAPSKPGISWTKETPVVGFLVSFDANPNGEVFELRTGRLMITSQPSGGSNCLLIRDESVSPMHAIMRISGSGELQVLDQLSEFGTKIQRFGTTEEQSLSGDKGTVEHGDILKFGNRKFHVCVIAKGEQA